MPTARAKKENVTTTKKVATKTARFCAAILSQDMHQTLLASAATRHEHTGICAVRTLE